jgi:hypothetical protein
MRPMVSLPLKTAFWLRIALKRMILRRTCFLLQKMVLGLGFAGFFPPDPVSAAALPMFE